MLERTAHGHMRRNEREGLPALPTLHSTYLALAHACGHILSASYNMAARHVLMRAMTLKYCESPTSLLKLSYNSRSLADLVGAITAADIGILLHAILYIFVLACYCFLCYTMVYYWILWVLLYTILYLYTFTYSCIVLYTLVYFCVLLYTLVSSCILSYTLLYTIVYNFDNCIVLYVLVCHCVLQHTAVYCFLLLKTVVYCCMFLYTCCARRGPYASAFLAVGARCASKTSPHPNYTFVSPVVVASERGPMKA